MAASRYVNQYWDIAIWILGNKFQWNLNQHTDISWWRHQVEKISALLAICAGNSPVPGDFPTQRLVTRSFDVFFDLCPNKRLSKQPRGWWFETPPWPLWHQCNVVCKITVIFSRVILESHCTTFHLYLRYQRKFLYFSLLKRKCHFEEISAWSIRVTFYDGVACDIAVQAIVYFFVYVHLHCSVITVTWCGR